MRKKRRVQKRQTSLRRLLLDSRQPPLLRPAAMRGTEIVITPSDPESRPNSLLGSNSSWDLFSSGSYDYSPEVLSFQPEYARRNSISLPCSPSPNNDSLRIPVSISFRSAQVLSPKYPNIKLYPYYRNICKI